MKHGFRIFSFLLFTPLSAWAGSVPAPEPDVLPLLGIGLAVAVAVKLFRKK